MKTPIIISLFAVFCLESSAQDLSSFYTISGFSLPALHTGQYCLSISPRFSSRPTDYSSKYSLYSPGNTSAGDYSNNLTYSTFGLTTNFTYGISGLTTFSLGLQYNPNQTTGKQTYNGHYTSTPSSVSTSNSTDNIDEEFISSSLILSHRFRPNIELSVSAFWSSTRQPTSGSELETSTDGGPSITRSGPSSLTYNRRAIDIYVTLIILRD